jgi:MFS family permease
VPSHLALAAYWFATNFLWTAMLTVLLPTEVLRLVPETAKATAIGNLSAAGAALAVVVHPLAGALSDRCRSPWGRRRPFFLAGNAVALVVLVLMAFVGTYRALLLAVLGLQLASNVALAPYQALIPDLVPEGERGLASGYMGLMSLGGTICSLALAAVFVHPGHTRPFYPWLWAVMAAGTAVTLARVPEGEGPRPEGSLWRTLWVPLRRYPDFWWVFLTRGLVMLAFYTVLAFLEYYLKDVLGLRDYVGATALLSGLTVVVAAAVTLQAGAFSDRVGRRVLVAASGLLMGLAAAAFLLVRSFPLALACGALFGVAYGTYTSVDWALAVDVLPAGSRSAAKDLGIWSVAITLPQVLAPAVGGRLIAHAGYAAAFGWAAACAVAGSLLIGRVRAR